MVLHVSPYRLKNLGSAAIFEIELLLSFGLPTDMTSLQVCVFKCSTMISHLEILLSTSAQGNHRLTTNGMLLTVSLDRLIVSNMYSEPNAWFSCLDYRLS
jgi:hypothetical protein